ncbi:MAG: DUF6088 family protein [Arenicella sp.]|nr:DUF6088 family protein [Arenicella sp.]
MSKLNQLKKHLRSGKIYRRADLVQWTTSVDRHLSELVKEGRLQKLSGGLYYCPIVSDFGVVPPKDAEVAEAFLKDTRFLLTSPNAYNSLGVGATQLYNKTVVYNHKRHGKFQFGNREFEFVKKAHFPKTLTPEFLLIDLVNNLKYMAEDKNLLLSNVRQKAASFDPKRFKKAVQQYGGVTAKNVFRSVCVQSS